MKLLLLSVGGKENLFLRKFMFIKMPPPPAAGGEGDSKSSARYLVLKVAATVMLVHCHLVTW